MSRAGRLLPKLYIPLTKLPTLQVVPKSTLTSCPLFFTHFWVGATAKQQQTHPKVSEKSEQMVRVEFGKEVLLVK